MYQFDQATMAEIIKFLYEIVLPLGGFALCMSVFFWAAYVRHPVSIETSDQRQARLRAQQQTNRNRTAAIQAYLVREFGPDTREHPLFVFTLACVDQSVEPEVDTFDMGRSAYTRGDIDRLHRLFEPRRATTSRYLSGVFKVQPSADGTTSIISAGYSEMRAAVSDLYAQHHPDAIDAEDDEPTAALRQEELVT